MNRKLWTVAAAGAILFVLVVLLLVWPRKPDLKSFPLRYLKGPEAAEMLTAHLGPGPVEGWSDRAVFVRAGRADLQTAAQLLQREDKPRPGVKLRFQLIEADGFATTDSAIAPVESVLRNLFRFKGYRLVAEAYIQARAESNASQTIVGADGMTYVLEAIVDNIAHREGKASAELRVLLTADRFGKVLETALNIPDGQTVVVGTARPSAERGAIILVVTPEIR